MKRLLVLMGILAAGRAGGAALPGFGVRLVGTAAGFASAVAVDSRGVIYYTTTKGDLFRLDDGAPTPDGSVQQFARGFRNPFDVAWDAAKQRLIVPDNGDIADDEINIVHLGDDCGWPYTMGDGPVIDGTTRPVYVFPTVVAPTGFTALS